MSRFYSDDPNADFDAWDAEQTRQLEQRPVCADCDEPIQDDHWYEFDGKLICPDCLESNYRKENGDCLDEGFEFV